MQNHNSKIKNSAYRHVWLESAKKFTVQYKISDCSLCAFVPYEAKNKKQSQFARRAN